ncbi:hypothetical protein B0H11DRAFT_1914841 [Mycena galericulata]|nr:hypothetical protein B0H11DRAFT_1914841 [Mycena galericulata]
MPMFSSSSFHIDGGTFNNVGKDVNIHVTQTMVGHNSDALETLESGLMESSSRPYLAAERRMLPYDVCRRSQLLTRSGDADEEMPLSSSIPSSHSLHPSFTQQGFNITATAVPRVFSQCAYMRRDKPWKINAKTRGIEHPSNKEVTEGARGGYSPPERRVFPNSDIDINSALFSLDNPGDHRTSINIGGNVNHIQRQGEPGLLILQRAAASDAFHDSAERYPQPKCHPETRTEMLDHLLKWASDTDSSSTILWLQGPAGAGKSAIAQSFCQKLETEGRLGASFFFKRGHPSQGTGNKLFPTIAYQLAQLKRLPGLKQEICRKVEETPSLPARALSIQLRRLIIEPCRQSFHSQASVIVIDGLDECEGQNIQHEILRSIGTVMHEGHCPLRFLIASRPEPHIREIFMGALRRFHSPVDVEQSFADVEQYLLGEFARIHREHHETMTMVPAPWPSPKIINHFVRKSSGYFIYASTIIRFVDDKDFRPTDRLKVIMGMKEPDSVSPFAALDGLYIQILSQTPARSRSQLIEILTVIGTKSFHFCVGQIEQLLGLKAGDVRLKLRGLHSVVGARKWDGSKCNDWSSESRITVYHASFYDFLQDPRRSGIFYLGDYQHRANLFCRRILEALTYMHDDPSPNAFSHVSWHLSRSMHVLQYIASSEPSLGLVTILRSFNADFLFNNFNLCGQEIVHVILDWLTRSRPLPEDLILLWKDYRFMLSCESIWSRDDEIQVTHQDRYRSCHILSQAAPLLSKILQAIKFSSHKFGTPLLEVLIMLDLSWEELRAVICSLRPLVRSEGERFIRYVSIVASDPSLFPTCFDSIMWVLSCGEV